MDPVPLNDQARVNANPGTQVLTGPEVRTIFLGMDQSRDELGHSSVKGKNPFKDVRVRKAFYQAIDEDAINKKVMRGQATPTALMIAPSLFSLSSDFHRFPFDPAASKKLLADAGYPDGFEVQLDCPNDRYVNDEQICQAVVGMLARIGIKVDLNAEPKSKFFAAISAAGGYDTSFYLLGWTPTTLESYNVFQYIMGCRDPKTNWGGNIAIPRSINSPERRSRKSTRPSATRFSSKPGSSRCSMTSATFRCTSRRSPGASRRKPT
jgi:peptide/nickel transport system substrate-binding protein